MCQELLANPLIESFEIEVAEASSVQAPDRRARLPRLERRPGRGLGARCARRRRTARLARRDGAAPRHGSRRAAGRFLLRRLPALRRDRPLRAGAGCGPRASPRRAGPVLGICNGFQILCEAGLLPGVLRRNRDLEFVCRDVRLRVERTDTLFTAPLRARAGADDPREARRGKLVRGRGAATRELEAAGQLVLRYAEDCNGSVGDVAGVCNEARNVFGLMPHPEHAVDPLLGLGRRRAAARRARRRRARAHARGRLTERRRAQSRSASSSPGCFSSAARSSLEVA